MSHTALWCFFSLQLCDTNMSFVEPFYSQKEVNCEWLFDSMLLTWLITPGYLGRLSSVILITIFTISNYGDLSIIILSSLPRRVTYVLSHPKNCFAVRFSKGSQCLAVTTIKVEMHTHALLWAVLYPIAQINPNQC